MCLVGTFFTAAGRLISKNRNVMNARVWLGLGKDGIPVAAKGIGGAESVSFL